MNLVLLTRRNNLEKNNKKQLSNIITFNLTENIERLGIKKLILENRDFLITWSNETQICIDFNFKSSSISKNIKLIEKKLRKELKGKIDLEIIEYAIPDIEDQIIKKRDKIYNLNKTKPSEGDSDPEFKSKFLEEVSNHKQQFEKSSNPYKVWQKEVEKKYESFVC
jgi:hypothetical protein